MKHSLLLFLSLGFFVGITASSQGDKAVDHKNMSWHEQETILNKARMNASKEYRLLELECEMWRDLHPNNMFDEEPYMKTARIKRKIAADNLCMDALFKTVPAAEQKALFDSRTALEKLDARLRKVKQEVTAVDEELS